MLTKYANAFHAGDPVEKVMPPRLSRLFGWVLVFASVVCMTVPGLTQAQTQRPAQTPNSAYDKTGRDDLEASLRSNGEVRVIVGLETHGDARPGGAQAPDDVVAAEVAARQARLLERLASYAIRDVKPMRLHHFITMTVDAGGLRALLSDPEVTSVALDRTLYPLLHDTPGIIRAETAWRDGYRGSGQSVAIIDTGVDNRHPFFTGKVYAEACYSDPVTRGTSLCPNGASRQMGVGAAAPCPDQSLGCWHGTHVAGIAAGRHGVLANIGGGIAPDAGVIPIQIFQRVCAGEVCRLEARDSDLALALEYVYTLRTTYNLAAVNLGLGGDLYTATCNDVAPALTSVIGNLRAAGIATVAAAGNDGHPGAITHPACISSAISVGATTKQNELSGFSNNASFLSLLAPGSNITSALPGGFGSASGTSMAAAHVTGALALLKQAKPTGTTAELLAALQDGGWAMIDPRSGIAKSLIQIGSGPGTPSALSLLLGTGAVATAGTLPAPATGASGPAVQSAALTAAPEERAAVSAAATPLPDRGSPRVPHDARNKSSRDDLIAPLREKGEIRVIVGTKASPQLM